MTPTQKITMRLSQVRQRLNEISGIDGDTFTEEIRSEAETLQREYADLEIRHRASYCWGSRTGDKVSRYSPGLPGAGTPGIAVSRQGKQLPDGPVPGAACLPVRKPN